MSWDTSSTYWSKWRKVPSLIFRDDWAFRVEEVHQKEIKDWGYKHCWRAAQKGPAGLLYQFATKDQPT